MTTYDLDAVPNQEMTIVAGGYVFNFTFRYFRDLMYCSVADNEGVVLATNVRCCNEQWLIPWTRFNVRGNFRFEDEEGEYPDYNRFGGKCKLVYYTADEVETGVN